MTLVKLYPAQVEHHISLEMVKTEMVTPFCMREGMIGFLLANVCAQTYKV